MAGLLGSYKKGDRLETYRQGGGLLDVLAETELGQGLLGLATDPVGQAKKAVSTVANKVREANRKNKEAFESGSNDLIASRALDFSQDALGFAPIGMTVWHGSPHKFDKFDMSKIGTGEGNQTYGHGLYFAENPKTAEHYSDMGFVEVGGKVVGLKDLVGKTDAKSVALKTAWGYKPSDVPFAISMNSNLTAAQKEKAISWFEKNQQGISFPKNLYKTDIPDEAVARFLDWDKPLSQQAPEVQKLMRQNFHADPQASFAYQKWLEKNPDAQAGRVFKEASFLFGDKPVTRVMNENGIPGIRYLDGGSRSAGQGSSNFVLFDDQLPRILEINGQATGNQPWARGEWGGLLDEVGAGKTGLLDSAPMDENFLFHGTGEGAFRRILSEGLKPNSKGRGYLSPTEQYAETYAQRKGNPFGNRVLRVRDEGNFYPDPSNGGLDFIFDKAIPPSSLELKVGNKWVPLASYYDESIGIMPR